MTPITQTQFKGEGVGGNCVQASVASILNLPLSSVPHFLEIAPSPDEWELAFEDWLNDRGLCVIRMSGEYVFEGLYLVSGRSPRGGYHMVVYRDGELEHDPHPSRAGVLDVRFTYILAHPDPAQA